MLLQLREKITGWIAYAVIGVISVPFALWGINFYFQDAGDPIVIEIADQEVTISQYRNVYSGQKRSLEEQFGNEIQPGLIRQQTLVSLLRDGLIRKEVERNGYTVADSLVAETIAGFEDFQTDGRFNETLFMQFLDENSLTFRQYRSFLRNRLRDAQLQSAVATSSFVLDAETELYESLYFQTRKIRYVEIDPDIWLDSQQVSDEEAKEFYNSNKEEFETPERFKMNYLELTLQEIKDDVAITEEEGRSYYESHLQDFTTPERRAAAHILFNPDQHGEDEAKRRAQEAYDRLLDGEDFADLAKEFSDDSLTADKGGRLDAFELYELEEVPGETIFSLQEGKFSRPVESRFGIQIFKLLAIEPEQLRRYEGALAEEILAELATRQALSLYDDKVLQLEDLTFENDDLSVVAGLSGLSLQKTDWILKDTQSHFMQYEAFRSILDDADGFSAAGISRVFEIEPQRAFVFRIVEKEPAKQREYETVAEEIVARLRQQKAAKEAETLAQQLVDELRRDTPLEEVVQEHALAIHDPGFIQRSTSDLPVAIVRAAYRVVPSGTDKKSYRAVQLSAEGDYVVIELIEIKTLDDRNGEEIASLSFAVREINLVLQSLTQTIGFEIDYEEIEKFEGDPPDEFS